jgi:hypothetical protein
LPTPDERPPALRIISLFTQNHPAQSTQFERLRNGDRFWYERKGMFSPAELAIVHNTVRLSSMNTTAFFLSS